MSEIKENENLNESHHLKKETKKNLLSRTIVALILVIIVVPAIVLGGYFFFALIFIAAMISTYEVIRVPQKEGKKFNWYIYVAAYITVIMTIYWVFIKNNINRVLAGYDFSLYIDFDSPVISLSAFVLTVSLLFLAVLFDKNFTIADAFYFMGMLFIISIGFQSLLFIRYVPFEIEYVVFHSDNVPPAICDEPSFKYFKSFGLLLYMLIGVCFNDIGALLFGIKFGKHKLAPRISPKKTIEGFIGGYVTSVILSGTFAFVLAATGYPMLDEAFTLSSWYNIVFISLTMPLLGTFGDLIFSSIKRYYSIKDFGTILKSHGGVLDRVDSTLFTSAFLGLIIPLIAKSWNILG